MALTAFTLGLLGCDRHLPLADAAVKTLVPVGVPGPSIDPSLTTIFALPSDERTARHFVSLNGVLAFADGGIAVVDAGVPSAFVFDAKGKLQEEVGRAGSGPGEFREPRLVAVWGDSLAIYDPPQGRLLVFTRAGTLARQTSIPARGPVQILGLLAGGDPLLKQTDFPDSTTNGGLIDARALLLRVRGEDLDTVATLRDGRWSPNGYRFNAWTGVAALTDTSIWIGEGNTPRLMEIAWDGTRPRSVRWESVARSVGDADREAMAAIARERGAAPGFIEAPERLADSVPLFGRLLPDPLGGVWALGYEAPFSPPEGAWRIDDRAGTVAAVELPPRFRPTQIGRDFLLGVLTDVDGVGRPARFSLERNRPAHD